MADLSSKPSLSRLLHLAWPMVVSRSSQTVMGAADAVMVASLGASALAAATTGGLNTFNVLILPMGAVFIVQSFCSQLYGQGDIAGARRYGWYGLGLGLLTQIFCLAMAWASPSILGLLSYEPAVHQQMSDYMRWRLPSGGAALGMEALANYYGGLGNTRLPMFASLLCMVLTVLGNWFLIGGHGGFPALGVRGAALSNSISTWIAFALLFACFLWRVGTKPTTVRAKWNWGEFYRMLRFGIPSGFNWFFEMLAFTFFVNVVIGGMGAMSLAALMAVLQVNSVAFMPAFAVASAGAILVGQSIGAGERHHVSHAVRLTLLVNCAWMGCIAILYFCIPATVLRPFAPADAEAFLAIAVGVLVVSTAWQIFDAVSMSLSEVLRAAGDTAFTMWARLALGWFFFVPGVLIVTRRWHVGAEGATACVVAYLALLAALFAWRYRSGAWQRINLVGQQSLQTSSQPPPASA